MQAIQINASVNLTSGLAIPSGSVVVIAEGYADIKAQKDGTIPSQIATLVYASVQSITEGKDPVQGVQDFNPVFSNMQLSVVSYETVPAETLLVNAVYDALVAIYGADNVEQITI